MSMGVGVVLLLAIFGASNPTIRAVVAHPTTAPHGPAGAPYGVGGLPTSQTLV